jgi:hypothetical protein
MSDKVSLRDVYNAVNSLEEKIGKRLDKIENRVDVLEDFKGRAIGMLSIFAIFSGAVSTWIWSKLTGK